MKKTKKPASKQTLSAVAGGRQAGGSKMKYLEIKMKEVLISGVATD